MKTPADIDDYIAGFPEATQERLIQLRMTIKKAAPEAKEVTSFGMTGFQFNGMLVWFAAFQNHIGLYPMFNIESFEKALADYKGKETQTSLHFPLDKPLPVDLIANIVRFKMTANSER